MLYDGHTKKHTRTIIDKDLSGIVIVNIKYNNIIILCKNVKSPRIIFYYIAIKQLELLFIVQISNFYSYLNLKCVQTKHM